MVRGGRRAARARARRREREARNFPPFEPAFAVDIGGSCEEEKAVKIVNKIINHPYHNSIFCAKRTPHQRKIILHVGTNIIAFSRRFFCEDVTHFPRSARACVCQFSSWRAALLAQAIVGVSFNSPHQHTHGRPGENTTKSALS